MEVAKGIYKLFKVAICMRQGGEDHCTSSLIIVKTEFQAKLYHVAGDLGQVTLSHWACLDLIVQG